MSSQLPTQLPPVFFFSFYKAQGLAFWAGNQMGFNRMGGLHRKAYSHVAKN